MPQSELTFSTSVRSGGRIELDTSLPEGSQVEVIVFPAGQKTDEVADLVEAAGSSLDFWDNPQDDEDWDNA